MKSHNKPIRMSTREQMLSMKKHDKRFKENNRHYGVTNWMVGTCETPLSPWVQIHAGYFSIQIKWYLIVFSLMVLCFTIGKMF